MYEILSEVPPPPNQNPGAATDVHNIRYTETGKGIALASAPKRQARGLCYSEGYSIRKGPNLDRRRSLLCTVSRNSLLHFI